MRREIKDIQLSLALTSTHYISLDLIYSSVLWQTKKKELTPYNSSSDCPPLCCIPSRGVNATIYRQQRGLVKAVHGRNLRRLNLTVFFYKTKNCWSVPSLVQRHCISPGTQQLISTTGRASGTGKIGIPRISRKMMKAGVSLRKYRSIKNVLSTGAVPPPLRKKSSEAAVSNFKAFPLKLPSPAAAFSHA